MLVGTKLPWKWNRSVKNERQRKKDAASTEIIIVGFRRKKELLPAS